MALPLDKPGKAQVPSASVAQGRARGRQG